MTAIVPVPATVGATMEITPPLTSSTVSALSVGMNEPAVAPVPIPVTINVVATSAAIRVPLMSVAVSVHVPTVPVGKLPSALWPEVAARAKFFAALRTSTVMLVLMVLSLV